MSNNNDIHDSIESSNSCRHCMLPCEKDAVISRIPEILGEVDAWKAKYGEVTLDMHRDAVRIVVSYCRASNLIVYGSYAWDQLLMGENDTFRVASSFTDVDILSDHPIDDVKAISDALHAAGMPYVNAKNSLHEETYSVYVFAQKCCDITYVPKYVMKRLPRFFTEDGLMIMHPRIVTMDIMRMFATPIASYWRLDRTMEKAVRLLTKYPLKFDHVPMAANNLILQEPVAIIASTLARKDSILWTGEIAARTYMGSSWDVLIVSSHAGAFPRLEAISTNFQEDLNYVITTLADRGVTSVRTVAFQPFINYLGARVDFVGEKDEVMFTLFEDIGCGFNYHVLPEDGRRVSTCFGTVYHLLARNLHAYVVGNGTEINDTDRWLRDLLACRDHSQPRFREFEASLCHGRPSNPHCSYLLRQVFKRRGRNSPRGSSSIIPSYRPGEPKMAIDPKKFWFRNVSGSPVVVCERPRRI